MQTIKSAFLALVMTATALVLASPTASAAGTFTHFIDYIGSPEPGRLRVAGWVFDDDAPATSIAVHVYIGGVAGDPAARGYDLGLADISRPGVAQNYPGAGEYHGFDATFDVPGTSGDQTVNFYAINAPNTPGGNALIEARSTTPSLRALVTSASSRPTSDSGRTSPSAAAQSPSPCHQKVHRPLRQRCLSQRRSP